MYLKKLNKFHYAIIFLTLVSLCLLGLLVDKPDGRLHLKVYDVGQGDSIFIKTAGGYKILVDGGPDNSVLNQLSKDLLPWDHKIDFVVLTHPQADHMTGLVETIKRYQISTLIYSGVGNNTQIFKVWEETLKARGVKKIIVAAGDQIVFPDQTKISFLWPREEHPVVTDLNAAAVVFRLDYGNFSALLTGDADEQVQPYTSTTSHVEVLKVPHHGSKTALNKEFAAQLSPAVSLISVGRDNKYGHPTGELLNLLKDLGTKVYRTDQNGSIEVVSNGKSWYTKPERGN